MDCIRTGKICSINRENGSARVVYPDRGNMVTGEFPLLSNGEFRMPEVGEKVLVLHFTNGIGKGIILGSYWTKDRSPADVLCDGDYYKLFTPEGDAYISYNRESKEILIESGDICFQTDSGTVSVSNLLAQGSESVEELKQVMFSHLNDFENPHNVEKRHLGISRITNSELNELLL